MEMSNGGKKVREATGLGGSPPRPGMRPGARQSPGLTGAGCGRHPGEHDKRRGGEGQDGSLAAATWL